MSDYTGSIARRVAVLCAAYNGEKWFDEQIDSILKQKNVDVDIYISVDYSTDLTYELALDKADLNHNIHILPYGDRFGGAAKNFFRLIRDIDVSNFDFIALSDQDDVWNDDKLFRGISIIESAQFCAYSSDVIAFWDDGKSRLIKKSYPQKKYDYMFESAGPGCTFIMEKSSFLVLKKFIQENRDAINCINNHDWFIYAFYRVNNLAWYIDPRPSMFYRQHSSNLVGVNSGLSAYKRRLKLISAGWYRNEVETLAKIFRYKFPTKLFILRNIFDIRRSFVECLILSVLIISGLY